MPGIRFDDSASAYVLLTVLAIFFVVANGFILHRHLTWAPRIRRLLEQEGFRVRQMERRWFTKGPFADMRPPGLKHHKEWLVRVVGEDREHRPRSGWVRWRSNWPWETADRWAVLWDEGPWTGRWGDAPATRKRGLSTATFMTLVLPPALAGMVMAVYLIARGIQQQQQNQLTAQSAVGASAPAAAASTAGGYEIRCRGGGQDAFQIDQVAAGTRSEPGNTGPVVLLSLRFTSSARGAGVDSAGLDAGTCAWLDRPLREPEPRVIRFEVPGIRATDPPNSILPAPGSYPDAAYLRDSDRYWTFFALNFNGEYLLATRHKRWTPSEQVPPANGTQR